MPELTPEMLLRAYSIGIFPMSESREDADIFWVDPEVRGIIPLDGFHLPRRARRMLRHNPFEVRCDSAFAEVIRLCAEKTRNRPRTWINDEIIRLYTTLHEMGHAHSVECWRGDRLVGGLYGPAIGGAFFGESMFSREPNASKIALIHLVARLIRGRFRLFDVQFVSAHLKQFGALEIPRAKYLSLLAAALHSSAEFGRELAEPVESFFQGESIVRQSITQMS